MSREEPFWIVWCPNGPHPPTYRHLTEDAAGQEAKRLANLHPGSHFYVCAALGCFRRSEPVEWYETGLRIELPF